MDCLQIEWRTFRLAKRSSQEMTVVASRGKKLREVVVHRLTPTVSLPLPGPDLFCDHLQIPSLWIPFFSSGLIVRRSDRVQNGGETVRRYHQTPTRGEKCEDTTI